MALNYSVAGTGNRLDANPVDAGDNTGTLSVAGWVLFGILFTWQLPHEAWQVAQFWL